MPTSGIGHTGASEKAKGVEEELGSSHSSRSKSKGPVQRLSVSYGMRYAFFHYGRSRRAFECVFGLYIHTAGCGCQPMNTSVFYPSQTTTAPSSLVPYKPVMLLLYCLDKKDEGRRCSTPYEMRHAYYFHGIS